MNENKIILQITPQTNVRATQGAKILFKVPEECPIYCGLPRKSQKQPKIEIPGMAIANSGFWKLLGGEKWRPRKKTLQRGWVRYGCPHSLSYENLMYKRRLERYNVYKKELKKLADEAGFILPICGFALYFYYPMPERYSQKKRKALHGQMKLTTPDIDNLEKAVYDSLSKKDGMVGQISGKGKFWDNNSASGYIEILLNQPVYNPFNVKFINQ